MHVRHSRLWILPDIKAVLYLVQSTLYLAYSHSYIVSVCVHAVLKTFDSIITFIISFHVPLYFYVTFHISLSPFYISLLPFIFLCLPFIFL